MRICLIAAIALASSVFTSSNASATMLNERSAAVIGDGDYLHFVATSKSKTAKSKYCTTYDVVSQSRIPCDSEKKAAPRTVTHTKKDYCTTYDVVSQSRLPCNSVKKAAPRKITNSKADYCTTYDVVSQSRIPCNSVKKSKP
jgi:hypothetical protein